MQRSNRNKAHIIAMKMEAPNDWEGRFAALHEGDREGRDHYVRGCVRLLLDRIALDHSAVQTVAVVEQGNTSPGHLGIPEGEIIAVMCALGPDGLVSQQMESYARRTLSEDKTCAAQVRFYRPRQILKGESGGVQFKSVLAELVLRVYEDRLEEVSAAIPRRSMVAFASFADSFRSHLSEASPERGSTYDEMAKEVMGFLKRASWNMLSKQG